MSILKVLFAVSIMGSLAFAGSPKDGVAALQKALTNDGKETPSLVKEPKIKVGDTTAPNIKFGKVAVGNNDDQLKKVVAAQGAGSAATVFVKDGSDFIRISTTILNKDGKKVLGTKLAADSPAFAPVSKGEAFCGEAKIVDFMFDTCYEPIKVNGETIGIYLFGIKK